MRKINNYWHWLKKSQNDPFFVVFGYGYYLLKQRKLDQLIDRYFRIPVKQCFYSFSDKILSFVLSCICGLDYLDNIDKTFRPFYAPRGWRRKWRPIVRGFKLASASILRKAFQSKEFISDSLVYPSVTGMFPHRINPNPKLNDLLVASDSRLGLIPLGEENILDIDTTIVTSGVKEATPTYLSEGTGVKRKSKIGFHPLVAAIGKIILYIEGITGHTTSGYLMKDSLERLWQIIEKYKIKIKAVRIDAAGFSKTVLEFLYSRNLTYYLRAEASSFNALNNIDLLKWRNRTIGGMKYKVSSFRMNAFEMSDFKARIVVYTSLSNKHTSKKKILGVITNDFEKSDVKIIETYNQRGGYERDFDYLKNDFQWRHCPFKTLEANTVYFILTALANNVFEFFKREFSKCGLPFQQQFRLALFNQTLLGCSGFDDRGIIKHPQRYDFYNQLYRRKKLYRFQPRFNNY